LTLLATSALIAIYIYTARREDKVLAENFAEEFPKWRDDTGSFFPKWR
jgi:protein-S-isoprenylcysteine O-methyltransferase Ste14